MKPLNKLKVAIAHDQLVEFGGAEKVLLVLKEIFPKADIYTTVYKNNFLVSFKKNVSNWKIYVAWFGKISVLKNFYSPFRFLTPLIWESFDLSKYDLVISSSGSWMSKGVITKKPTIHISYIHHPPRYLYGYETAIEWQKYLLVKIYAYIVNHFLRLWDFESSQKPDYLIANSYETKKRIEKFYRQDSTVIYPPVEIPKKINLKINKKNKYYITVSRLARAKHVDILIKAANQYGFNLKVIGTGRDEKYLKSIAGKTVEFFGYTDEKTKNQLYENAYGFLFASVDEEFGIAPVEAMGYGLPVIAFNSGGIPEYLKNNFNGYLYNQLTPKGLIEKINLLEKLSKNKLLIMKKNARKTAKKFTKEIFKEKFINFIKSKINFKNA